MGAAAGRLLPARDLEFICRWAGLRSGNRFGRPVPAPALRRLIAAAASNASGNIYRHAGHFAHVVLAAGVLAACAGLRGEERSLLVLAGLVHDLDHQGRRASSRHCHQERFSAQRAVRVIAGCRGDGRLALRIHSLLLATALTNDVNRSNILKSDRLARLLTDADIFASVIYPRQRSMEMTRALKLEQRLVGSVAALNRRFAEMIGATGLQSDLARSMLRTAVESRHPSRNILVLDS
ncbi:MAG: hypothetical protein EBT94_12845 [Alphaproteobacteria bacterium]|nr:hypothetical protein [Alphaproteobacteria bacterium]